MKTNPAEHIRSIALDLILTVLCCGLWNMVVQYYHCKTLNELLKQEKYVLWKISVFTLLTCGIYYFYFEYMKAEDFQKTTGGNDTSDPILALVMSIFGFGFVYDAILQSKINRYFENQVATNFRE